MSKLIVLDRDGVINEDSSDYVKTLEEWRPLPGSIEAIARLSRAGHLVSVATNQSGLARGLVTPTALAAMHARLATLVQEAGGEIHSIRYCPHGPAEGCSCRKPKPGLILAILEALDVDADDAVMVGDSLRDIEAGRAAGTRAVLVRTGNGRRCEADARARGAEAVFDDLADFADHVLGT